METGSGKACCLNADARDEESYRRARQAMGRPQLLLTDPPYCLLTRRRKGGDLRDPKQRKLERGPLARFESVRDYRQFTQAWLPKAVELLEGDAPLVLWTNLLGRQPLKEVAAAAGYPHGWGEFAWCKPTRPESGGEQLLRLYEVALVLGRTPPPPKPGPSDPAMPWAVVAGYDPEGTAARFGAHPNHKPFAVLEPLIRSYSRPGALILDPFGGSGSIPAAAVALGRRAVCFEVEPQWAERIGRRLMSASSPGPSAASTP